MLQQDNTDCLILLSRLLEYPTDMLSEWANEAVARLQVICPRAAILLAGFCEYVNTATLAKVEELYTTTFDLQGVCCPYVGHHLFGDNYKRSWFMACLNREYHHRGLDAGVELPDHIALILRFVALGGKDEFTQALVCDGLLPALEKMTLEFNGKKTNPYRLVIQAVLSVMGDTCYSSLQTSALTQAEGAGDD